MQSLKPMDSPQKHFSMSVTFHSCSKNLHFIPVLTFIRSQELTTKHLQLFAAICICFPLHRGSLAVFNRNIKGKHHWNVFEGNLWTVKEEKNSLSVVTRYRWLQSANTWHNQSVFSWFKSPNEKPGNTYWGYNCSPFLLKQKIGSHPHTPRVKKKNVSQRN